ncbi:MAG: DNA repair protein RecN [Cytophagales bacterium]
MLASLKIQNYALIKNLEVSLDAKLNIITGETGAGKSIILGAIGLLKGLRADTKALLNQEDKCVIEAEFDVHKLNLEELFLTNDVPYENECIIRREIAPSGRSRAFINDSPVTLDVLLNISTALIDVHSQHDTLLLENSTYQIEFIDAFAQNSHLKNKYSQVYKEYSSLKKELKTLEEQSNTLSKSNDYDTFLLKELLEAKLQESEDETLKKELNIIENTEEIKTKIQQVLNYFTEPQYGVLSSLKSSAGLLDKVSAFQTALESLKQRTYSSLEELKDVCSELEDIQEQTEYDPERAILIRERLDLIYSLQAKHKVNTVAELLNIAQSLENKLGNFENFDEKLQKLKQQFSASESELKTLGAQLSESRLAQFQLLRDNLIQILQDLSIPNADLVFEHKLLTEPQKNGFDAVDILFTANKGFKPQKLKNVASGGEFSRLMLAIKYILASKKSLPTLIFDEIDTGVSGDVALKMAQLMKGMSRSHQVITITHLPQIASFGEKHLFVYKDHSSETSTSNMRVLDAHERVQHIAEMIGGKEPTALAVANAKEMLNQNNY